MDNAFGKYNINTISGSIYCYKDTNVLRNRFGVRDSAELKEIENDITTIRQQDMLQNPINLQFTVSHLCAIHKYLFGDIYFFAGKIRKESIAKGGTIFEAPQTIKPKLKKLLAGLNQDNYLHDAGDDFIARLAYYFAELNYILPFREGNGRATREFIRLLLLRNGYTVDWSGVTVEFLLDAMSVSMFDTTELIEVLKKCISLNTI